MAFIDGEAFLAELEDERDEKIQLPDDPSKRTFPRDNQMWQLNYSGKTPSAYTQGFSSPRELSNFMSAAKDEKFKFQQLHNKKDPVPGLVKVMMDDLDIQYDVHTTREDAEKMVETEIFPNDFYTLQTLMFGYNYPVSKTNKLTREQNKKNLEKLNLRQFGYERERKSVTIQSIVAATQGNEFAMKVYPDRQLITGESSNKRPKLEDEEKTGPSTPSIKHR